ncbi:MAG: DUF3303 family protein [Chloroflexi bacterium]|jgi:hypothetical protein|nr:DUF3303 family protein [Chloroflexota bacterium]
MLFAIIYTAKDVSEDKEKRSLKMFGSWQRPAGYEEKAQYAMADGSGGIAIVEISSSAVLAEAMAPWGPYFDFKVVPIVEIADAVPMLQRVYAWRDSVS